LVLKHEKIYVLTNLSFFPHFNDYINDIVLIDSSTLHGNKHHYVPGKVVDVKFRNGFWALISQRFYCIYHFMKMYDIQNVIHIENDVVLYYHCHLLQPMLNPNKICIPMDSYHRSIASIMYIPTATILGLLLDNYNTNANDMQNLAFLQNQKPYLFDNFPICCCRNSHTPEQQFVSRRFDEFTMIFDAAAIGQYLGGIDPRNYSGNTIGFVNETSVIKYSDFQFQWQRVEIKRPFLVFDEMLIPIFNLHIHSKKLENFI
jgi:hypothetical protein